jgi:hypothetical protein
MKLDVRYRQPLEESVNLSTCDVNIVLKLPLSASRATQ